MFAINNFIAVGALKTLRAINLRVPEDVSLVAFDDLPQMDPLFTVVSQPAYAMGQQATQLLLRRLSGDTEDEYRDIVLPTTLITRQSSGVPWSN